MTLFGAMAGAEGWEDLAAFSAAHEAFFATILDIPHGTPSADTFRRVLEAISPEAFQEAFQDWLSPLLGNLEGQTVAIDGKSLRGAFAHSPGRRGPFHLLHVWATEERLLLAQSALETAGHEAKAVVQLLSGLQLQGATVTADAASCNAEVTRAIRDRSAHYVLSLKGNQSALHEHVRACFDGVPRDATLIDSESDEGHGRSERRFVRALPARSLPKEIRAQWTDLKSIVEIVRARSADDLAVTRAFYISSHAPNAALLARRIRDHWKIENELHHVLDVTFGEDRRKIRSKNGAQNFALVCRHAVALLKRDPMKKSVAMKRKMAMWNPKFGLQYLSNGISKS